MTSEELHRAAVRNRVLSAIALGALSFHDILVQCEGADPNLVAELITEVKQTALPSLPHQPKFSKEVFIRLPASDPFRSQWWFTGDAVDYLSSRATAIADGGRVLCLGVPTLGYALLSESIDTIVLDVDQHVIDAVNVTKNGAAQCYDVAQPLPDDIRAAFRVAVIDPPWYDDLMYKFIERALTSVAEGGELLCTLPPRLTRPGTDDLRNRIVNDLLQAGYQLLGLEVARLGYIVPRFEEVALGRIQGFRAIPWRYADLLHVRRPAGAVLLTAPEIEEVHVRVFTRSPHEFRVFLRNHRSLDEKVVLERLEAYSKNVSTRAHAGELPDLWTTEKTGVLLGQPEAVESALLLWEDVSIRSPQEAITQLSRIYSSDLAKNVIRELDKHLGLWSNFAAIPPLRTDDEIEAAKKGFLTQWATEPSQREHRNDGDIFRGSYQRDRDRVLWSGAFRRLAHKTQLFPTEHDDQVRQRLTHSIEVMQLASTIGASFGLDRDLIEAGALAHDIGHTPFGHAGEHALDRLFNEINSQLGGFNHYEHGVDVVRWLEGPYYVSQTTSFHGLNLTPEVAECILKHTYCQAGDTISAEEILKISKHSGFIRDGYCHLEGQAVRIADKISYLVSDLEDGIRLGAITLEDLLTCRFFHRAPLTFTLEPGLTLYQRFIEQRRTILKLLMEDVLVATNKRLARTVPQKVYTAEEYTVNHSQEILSDMDEIWKRLQAGRLHEDRRVKVANLRAARIVSDLTITFATTPALIEPNFAGEHSRLRSTDYLSHYRKLVGRKVSIPAALVDFLPLERLIGFRHLRGQPVEVAIEDLVQAKDFVAGLTDSRARALHAEILDK